MPPKIAVILPHPSFSLIHPIVSGPNNVAAAITVFISEKEAA